MYILDRLRQETKHNLHIVHINHGERIDSSIDEKIVQEYCQKNNIDITTRSIEIPDYTKAFKTSTEDAGRIARREIFEEIHTEKKADYIVTAHHKDDLVETLLYRIIR